MFNPALAKIAINLVVSHCSGKVVGHVIRANITPATRLQKVQFAVGTFALGAVAGEASANALVNQIEVVEAFVAGVREKQQEQHQQEQE